MIIGDNKMKNYKDFSTWVLTERQFCDLELLLNGAFSQLNGFMDKESYESVINNMRLQNGALWPIPITLDVDTKFAESIEKGETISLLNKEGFLLATLTIHDIWLPDLKIESEEVYKTNDTKHPGVNFLLNDSQKVYIGGEVKKIELPHHYDYNDYRHTPEEMKNLFSALGWEKIVAFQTRNPIHRAHYELTKKAMNDLNASLLLHPAVGMTKPGDIDYHTRVRCYQHIINRYKEKTVLLSLLPLAMRMAGPRETLLHAIIRKNYGCTHFIVGRDHAGPGNNSSGRPFYGPYDAQNLLMKYENEIEIEMVKFKFMVYVPESEAYEPIDELDEATEYKMISGTQLRDLLNKGEKIPEWFTFKDISRELVKSNPPLIKKGFTILFTGLSGSGKSTLANGLMIKLLEQGSRPVTLLDGDIVRTHLSSELGFSKEHRSLNVRRIGFVANEITKNNGIAICAPIAPYEIDRKFNKEMILRSGGYIEIYVNTSLEKCEERDSKGLYELARKGVIKEFTGISDPYEKPLDPDITINSSGVPPEHLVDQIYLKIIEMGYIKS